MQNEIVARNTKTGRYYNGTNFTAEIEGAKRLPDEAGVRAVIRGEFANVEFVAIPALDKLAAEAKAQPDPGMERRCPVSGHTPGPWHCVVSPVNGKTIFVQHGDEVVASFPVFSDVEANARLISAAPELLEALEFAAAYLRKQNDAHAASALCHASAAIAKARGGSL